MRHSMTLLHDPDHLALVTDATLPVTTSDGKQHTVMPFRLGPQQLLPRTMPPAAVQRHSSQGQSPALSVNPTMPVGTPISMQAQLKKMQPPAVPLTRIPSNGSMRPPAPPNLPNMTNPHASPPQLPQSVSLNGHDPNAAETSTVPELPSLGSPQVHPIHVEGVISQSEQVVNSASPTRPSSQNQSTASITIPVMPNGYHMSAYPAPTGVTYPASSNGLSAQQMQTIKSAFAGIPNMHEMQAMQANGGNMIPRVPQTYMGHVVPNNVSYEMQMRQMTWNHSQRVPSTGINGSMSPTPGGAYSPQSGAQAVNGMRLPVSHNIGQHMQSHSPSPLLQSPSPANVPIHSSPPRPPSQPMPSPSLHAQ